MDWDNDGKLDILSGCYWTDDEDGGFIQILRGKSGLDFEASENLLAANGKPLLNRPLSGETSGGMDKSQTATICTHQHAVDYDGDGDLDLVVGCFGSEFFLYLNEGSSEKKQLAQPEPLPVKSSSYHAAPHLADWDGDGDLDLLSGTAEGGAIISVNTGTREEPEWSEFKMLVEAPKGTNGLVTMPGRATRLWTTDWNDDGKLDLLLGDANTVVKPKKGVALAEFEKRQTANAAEMATLIEKAKPIQEKMMKLSEEGKELDQAMMDQMEELSKRAQKLSEEAEEFSDSKSTGFVWLYVRQ